MKKTTKGERVRAAFAGLVFLGCAVIPWIQFHGGCEEAYILRVLASGFFGLFWVACVAVAIFGTD